MKFTSRRKFRNRTRGVTRSTGWQPNAEKTNCPLTDMYSPTEMNRTHYRPRDLWDASANTEERFATDHQRERDSRARERESLNSLGVAGVLLLEALGHLRVGFNQGVPRDVKHPFLPHRPSKCLLVLGQLLRKGGPLGSQRPHPVPQPHQVFHLQPRRG